jgi:hypothetical protein
MPEIQIFRSAVPPTAKRGIIPRSQKAAAYQTFISTIKFNN